MTGDPFGYDISKGAEDLFNEFVGQCPQCGNDVMGEDGYEVCLGCDAPFHVQGCLNGRYLEGVGYWCVPCLDDGKHTEVCPQCGHDVKDFTELDDHNMCHDCLGDWKMGRFDQDDPDEEI